MAKLLKLRRGTDTQHSTFTGAEGEVTVNTTNDSLHVHDGTTAGGRELMRADKNNMPASGVTAGTYGSSSAIPAITVDANGLVTSATTSAIDSTSISNGTSNVSVASGGDITVTRAGTTRTTFSGSGVNIVGELTVDKIVVQDDGSTSPTMVVKSDDNAITGFVVKNDTYSTNEEIGFKINQGNDGTVQVMNVGNSEYKGINFQTLNGTGGVKNAIVVNPEASVDLYYNNGVKLQTQSGGINVTGTVQANRIDAVNTGGPMLVLKDSDSSGNAATMWLEGHDSAGTQKWYVGDTNANGDLRIRNQQASSSLILGTSAGDRVVIDPSGNLNPDSTNSYDLGTSSKQWRNAYFDGTVTCDGLSCNGSAVIESGVGVLSIKDNNNTGNNTENYIQGVDSANVQRWYLGYASTGNQDLYISNMAGGQIRFRSSNNDRIYMQAAGHFVPAANNAQDLGNGSNRWRNVYTNDLNLSNEGSTNDVDGTWGSWTIQEGEDDLFLLNRRNGKKYKFNLSEVN